MKFKHHNPPQFDLPVIGEEFNLRAEQAADGERLAHERQQAEADRADAEQRQPTLAEVFGEPVASYTRRQAIEDGVLVDLSRAIEPCPFKYPVAMTRAAYAATVEAGGRYGKDPAEPRMEVLTLPGGQDVVGRVHDVFWMLQLAIGRASGPSDRVEFSVCVDVHGNGRRTQVDLWSVCGPGDDGAPVITIMLQGED